MKLKYSGILLVLAHIVLGYLVCPIFFLVGGFFSGVVRDCWRVDI